jgi:hypothetical protein
MAGVTADLDKCLDKSFKLMWLAVNKPKGTTRQGCAPIKHVKVRGMQIILASCLGAGTTFTSQKVVVRGATLVPSEALSSVYQYDVRDLEQRWRSAMRVLHRLRISFAARTDSS